MEAGLSAVFLPHAPGEATCFARDRIAYQKATLSY